MTRTVLSTAFRVGRATALAIGVAVMVALVLGLASAALGADGGPFKLGKSNIAQSVTSLIKGGAGPALNLQVDSGPPLSVNSSARVDNLNSDQLDGKDSSQLRATSFYEVNEPIYGQANTLTGNNASCDAGDEMVSGGYVGLTEPGAQIVTSAPNAPRTWGVIVKSGDIADNFQVRVVCYDFPPAHVLRGQ